MDLSDGYCPMCETAAPLSMTDEERAARRLGNGRENFRNLEAVATKADFERLRSGRIYMAEIGAVHLDALHYLNTLMPTWWRMQFTPARERGRPRAQPASTERLHGRNRALG